MILDAMDVEIKHDDNDNWRHLRDYQHHVVTGCRIAYGSGFNAPLLVMPTGAGKTTSASYMIGQAALRGNNTLILVHRRELVKQFSAALENYGIRHGLITASDRMDLTQRVQVASAQTLVQRMDKIPWMPSLIVIDEAHHATDGSGWGKIIARYPFAKLLGLTATPIRLDGKGLGKGFGGPFDSMVLGPPPSFLMERGNLCNYRIFGTAVTPDMSGVRSSKGDWSRKESEARTDKPAITGNAVAHYAKYAKGKRAAVFTCSRAHAEHVASEFRAGGHNFVVVDGTLDDYERDRRIAALSRHEIDGIVTVDLISEGFDLPAIECAISLRATKSISLWIQQLGRVLRPAPGKDYAIILDHVGNATQQGLGLPDDDREWSLQGLVKKTGKKKDEDPNAPTQCERCYHVYRPKMGRKVCPECGHAVEVQSREMEVVDGELQEIDVKAIRIERRKKMSACKTLEDFQNLAQELGYKPGWARIQMELRQKRR
ncbi:MAG: DEAD/DEAH box helicase family protein [Marinospirillum sp.]|uniref:DEAD/DEAH box helicase n=1 Tax=Marinospirillum sp. TaxID=2183934 RepID=UPI0019DF2B0F|nr:DEAD/DEAH box helicase family protein [Marinospirillum sp.]MBE0505877.1 DEAD/DEAH box helicase family protein [Marinospirillum sp.]